MMAIGYYLFIMYKSVCLITYHITNLFFTKIHRIITYIINIINHIPKRCELEKTGAIFHVNVSQLGAEFQNQSVVVFVRNVERTC